MMSLFSTKPPIDEDEFEWLLAASRWFIDEFGYDGGLGNAALVSGSTEFFPFSNLRGHSRAEELFDQVKCHARMTNWPCLLVAGEAERDDHVGIGLAIANGPQPPLGTFQGDGRDYIVTYNPSLLSYQEGLIATFAHELAHYLIHSGKTNPPGGEELEEHATDLAAVMMGFGIFMANASKNFSQFQTGQEQGWQMKMSGYLSENALTTVLAIFVRLTNSDAKTAISNLKPYLRSPFKAALKTLDKRYKHLGTELSKIDLSIWE